MVRSRADWNLRFRNGGRDAKGWLRLALLTFVGVAKGLALCCERLVRFEFRRDVLTEFVVVEKPVLVEIIGNSI